MGGPRLRADFNGLFGDLLCLSHTETAPDETGRDVRLVAGMVVTAFEEDPDSLGNPDSLIATGVVELSPDWLQCKGSRWVLRIDGNGVRHESELQSAGLKTIYVYLLDEGVDAWRPVQARHLGDDRYEIISVAPTPEVEHWEFVASDIVRCRLQRLAGGETLVAYELVQRSA